MLNVPNNCCWSSGTEGKPTFQICVPGQTQTTAGTRDARARPRRAPRRSQQCSVGTKLWPNFPYLRRRRVGVGRICFIHHIAIETQRHHPALLSAKISRVCKLALHVCSVCSCSRLFVLFIPSSMCRFICSNTVETIEKGRHIGNNSNSI